MSEIVEAIAKVLIAKAGADPGLVKKIWQGTAGNISPAWPKTLWPEMISVSKDILRAIRIPTETMKQAAIDKAGSPFKEASEGYWQAMIDAALAETP